MKIYEKPLVDVKTFDVEDVMTNSGIGDGGVLGEASETLFKAINPSGTYSGVAFKW